MKLLDLLAEALSAEKEAALRDKYVQVVDKEDPMARRMSPEMMDPTKISEREFKALLDIDQTPNGTYMNWILPRYVKLDRTERKRFFEDEHNEQVKNLLAFFEKNKQKIKKLNISGFSPDINLYKTLSDFENVLGAVKAQVEGEGEGEQLGPEKFSAGFIKPIEILGKTPSGFVVYKVPQSCRGNEDCYKKYLNLTGCGDLTADFNPNRENEPAPRAGYRVTWCTRNTGSFNNYLKDGPYFLFKNWDTRRQYQIHYESGQLKDESNSNINGYNGKLQKEFIQFLLEKEGKIPPQSMSFDLDLSKFKIGEEEGYDIFKVGPTFYLDAKTGADQQNKLVYYDSSTGLLKNSDGTPSGAKSALKFPYIYLIKFLANKGVITKDSVPEEAYKHWMMIRILGNINVPETAKPVVNGNVNISGTAITKLPNNLTVTGDLNISNTKLTSLPPGLKVGGTLDVRGTGIKVPSGVAAKVIQD
jgi:hypothetical protein